MFSWLRWRRTDRIGDRMSELIPPPLTFPPASGSVLVLPWRVIDGDTVEACLLIRETFRLIGINAPELHGPKHDAAVKCQQRLSELCGSRPLTAKLAGIDRYGRRLAILYGTDDKCINQQLVEEGLAVKWDGSGVRPE